MNALALHYHPLSSYCQKVLIALDELGIDVDRRMLNLGDAAERSAFLALWPTGKMPLLIDGARAVPETTIIIEHLQRHHAAAGRALIPSDLDQALDVRLWDRLFDQYVMTPMQAFTADLLRAEPDRDPLIVAKARKDLVAAYAWLDKRLDGRTWVAGDAFTMADCAAAPALFYAVTYVPFANEHRHLAAYFARLMDRPSVARAIDHAKPWFKFFPNRQALDRRFYDPAT
ncbi:glutathione S-transferase family protein [Variovorax sp. KK3]|uniref:glutathione S-transferase family protein n=1 Tax=Variovorax sp. KK3 TaxID=1855728 RepID=UPI00097C373D|nr:glutathione S-transferase family protein [Variovorax sp. KK3]